LVVKLSYLLCGVRRVVGLPIQLQVELQATVAKSGIGFGQRSINRTQPLFSRGRLLLLVTHEPIEFAPSTVQVLAGLAFPGESRFQLVCKLIAASGELCRARANACRCAAAD
jgi:hypothetical protein